MKRSGAPVCTSVCPEEKRLSTEFQKGFPSSSNSDSSVKFAKTKEDFFVFTAGSSGIVRVTQSDFSSIPHKRRWETSYISGAWSDENGNLWIPVIQGHTYQFGVVDRHKTGPYEVAFSYVYQGTIPVTVSIFSIGYNSSSVLKPQYGRTGSASYDRLSQVPLSAKMSSTESPTGISPYEENLLTDLDVLAEARFSRYAPSSLNDAVFSGWNEDARV